WKSARWTRSRLTRLLPPRCWPCSAGWGARRRAACQSQRRRHCAGAPSRGQRRSTRRDRDVRADADGWPLRPLHHVHRGRARDRRRHRTGVRRGCVSYRGPQTNTGGPLMNGMWFAGLLPLLLAAAPEQAEDSKPADTIPAPSNIRGAEFPRIHDDLRVTFRIKAPDAQKVEFGFFNPKRYPAQKDENGFWTATTEPQVSGFHYYRVFVDGAEVNDPASETFYG